MGKKKGQSILIIDDDTFMCGILEKYLTKNGFAAESAYTGSSGLDMLKKKHYDLVLCDYRLPNTDGMKMLLEIQKLIPEAKVIIITAYADIRVAVDIVKAGATDYIIKPIQHEELLKLIRETFTENGKSKKKKQSGSYAGDFVMGESQQMKEIMEYIEIVAPTEMTVLIQGDTGSGKEYIARMIHANSERKNKPFIAVDCGAIPKDLANSELFGHVKGSFTGAIDDKIGYFEQANGGTLFLDEVGNLLPDIQVKLLRSIQERSIQRVGDKKHKDVDVRIIVATNEDIYEDVRNGVFREDLYHRINEFKINLPPLRERKEDIMIFAEHFLTQANEQLGKNVMGLDKDVKDCFKNYRWSGNIREMKNVIKRSVLLTKDDYVHLEQIPPEVKEARTSPISSNTDAKEKEQDDYGTVSQLKERTRKTEKQAIIQALEEVNYNKSKAARILNVDRKTLYNKMKQFNIELGAED